MGRHGYQDDYDCDYDQWTWIKWRGQVASATRGQRGQRLFHDLLAALDAMPVKRLIADEFWNGEVCALGALAERRGLDPISVDTENYDQLAASFDVARQLVQEVEYLNDEGGWCETPEQRWTRMRAWVASQLKENWPINRQHEENIK